MHKNHLASRALRLLTALVLALVLSHLAGCGGSSTGNAPSVSTGTLPSAVVGPVPAAQAQMGSEGGTITVSSGPLAGLAVTIPAGALKSSVIISIVQGGTMSASTCQAAGPAVTLLPSGLTFERPVTVRLPLSGNTKSAGLVPSPTMILNGIGNTLDDSGNTVLAYQLMTPDSTDSNSVSVDTYTFSTFQPVLGSTGTGAALGTTITTPADGMANAPLTNVAVSFSLPGSLQLATQTAGSTQTSYSNGTLRITSESMPEIDLTVTPSTGVTLGGTVWLDASNETNSIIVNGLTIDTPGAYTLTFTSPMTPGFTAVSQTFNVSGSTLAISPGSTTIAPTGTQQFTASGGTGTGYTWSLKTNGSGGSIDASSGLYTAGSTDGATDVIQVTDSALATATVNVRVSSTLVSETFSNATAPTATLGGTALLTGNGTIDPIGSGWLRLTDSSPSQKGYAYLNQTFNLSHRLNVDLDFTAWGGSGADGISVFLCDAGTTPFTIGAEGGSLCYAQNTLLPGMGGGYVGVGLDEFGGYAASGGGHSGGTGSNQPNTVTVRGSVVGFGNGATGQTSSTNSYPWIATSSNNGTLWINQGTRPAQNGANYRHLRVQITAAPSPTANVWVTFGASTTPVQMLTNEPLPAISASQVLKLGFGASTGGSTNYHEIQNVVVTSY